MLRNSVGYQPSFSPSYDDHHEIQTRCVCGWKEEDVAPTAKAMHSCIALHCFRVVHVGVAIDSI